MDAEFFDSLFEGDSPNGVKLGMGFTGGDFWPRIAGCQILYRGSSMKLIDFANILTVAETEACEISPPSYVQHSNDTSYFYVIRRSNSCGDQEHTLAAAVKVSINADGELAKPQPNNVYEVKVQQVDGNKVQLIWYYCPIEQQSVPVHFKIYHDAGTGQIDYENLIATIHYAGRMFYSYRSDTLDAGRYLFAVRAEDAAGIENRSLARIKIQLDTTNPDAIDILSVKAI